MLDFLFRNDRGAAKRVKRRLSSPRASVFLEFALIAPILIMFVSAMIELVGFWDSQIMANHAAWQVGRIAMVRGYDGMAFTNELSHISSTGVVSTNMPPILQQALGKWISKTAGDFNKFNDRGVITTAFLMMTCEMGYFGKVPSESFQDVLKEIFVAPIETLKNELPELLSKAALEKLKVEFGTDFGNLPIVGNLIQNFINDILSKAISGPIQGIASVLENLLTTIFKKIDFDFGGDDAGSLLGREFFSTARRIAMNDKKSIVSVEPLDDTNTLGRYVFSRYNPLDFPQVVTKAPAVDTKVKKDGVGGWPPKNQALQMVHTKISWPYSRGWLFPVVSGYQTSAEALSNNTTRAIGHSLVLPSPNIVNANLYSTGAVEYAEGSYTNRYAETFQDIINEMTPFLKQHKYAMQYRIREDYLEVYCLHKHKTTNPNWAIKPWWDDVFPGSYYKYRKMKGDKVDLSDLYEANWVALTGSEKTNRWKNQKKANASGYFDPSYYHSVDYLRFPDEKPYDIGYRYDNDYDYFAKYYEDRVTSISETKMTSMHSDKILTGCGADKKSNCGLKNEYKDIEKEIKPSLSSYVRVFEGEEALRNYDTLLEETKKLAKQCEIYYEDYILKLIHDEIADIDRQLNGQETPGDIIPENTAEALEDPQKAIEEARKKWKTFKKEANDKWRELNRAIHVLEGAHDKYVEDSDKIANPLKYLSAKMPRVNPDILDELYLCCHEAAVAGVSPLKAEAWIKANHKPKFKLTQALTTVKSDLNSVSSALKKCRDLELEYGKLFEFKSAKDQKELDPEDIDPGASRDPEGPPRGDLSPGSDDDRSGDKWHRVNGYWERND